MATSITTVKATPESAIAKLARRYPLMAFFVLAYALSWPYMIVDALGSHGLLPFRQRAVIDRIGHLRQIYR